MQMKEFIEQLRLEFQVKPVWLDAEDNAQLFIWPLLQVAAEQFLELITIEQLHIDKIVNLSRDYNNNLTNIVS